jgi:hypothetical protein
VTAMLSKNFISAYSFVSVPGAVVTGSRRRFQTPIKAVLGQNIENDERHEVSAGTTGIATDKQEFQNADRFF